MTTTAVAGDRVTDPTAASRKLRAALRVLRRTEVFGGVSGCDLEALGVHAEFSRLERNQRAFAQGAGEASYLCVVVAGRMGLVLGAGMRKRLVAVLAAPDVFGELTRTPLGAARSESR